jgi:nicotinamidase-related amidase
VSLNIAIPNVVFDAVNRGYQVVVVTDAVAGVPVDYGRAVIENTLALLATLVSTEELLAAWTPAP